MPILLVLIVIVIMNVQPNFVYDNALNMPPSFAHIFGTDALGRDVWSRTIVATCYSIVMMLSALLVALVIGVSVGVISGLSSKKVGDYVMIVVDFMNSLPNIVYVLLIVSLLKPTIWTIPIIIGCCSWMTIARHVRMTLLKERQLATIQMAKQIGTTKWHRFKRYYVPAVLPVVSMTAVQEAMHMLFTETTISFLGFGLPLNTPTLGNLLIDAQQYFLLGSWWNIVFPGLCLAAISIALLQVKHFMVRGGDFDVKRQQCKRFLQWPFGRRKGDVSITSRGKATISREEWHW